MKRQDTTRLQDELQKLRQRLNTYFDLMTDMSDDEAYVARGNGFCDTKYSEDFIESQINALQTRIDEIEQTLANYGD